jgi:hypothetical protein
MEITLYYKVMFVKRKMAVVILLVSNDFETSRASSSSSISEVEIEDEEDAGVYPQQ